MSRVCSLFFLTALCPIVATGSGCATAAVSAHHSPHIFVASIRPQRPEPVPATSTPAAIAPDAKASDYLAMGLTFYQANQKSDAARAFNFALSTGNLNNQGRALAYWHLFLAHRDANLQGPGAEALESFVTVSTDLLDQTGGEEESGANVREFIDGFNLTERMLLAELVLDALWARRDPEFGRTPERPVQVRDADAERLFVQLFKPCVQSEAPEVKFSAGRHPRRGQRVDKAQISCPNAGPPMSFYFTTKTAAP